MPEPLIVILGDEDQKRGYKVGLWGTYPNYECVRCAYSTIFEPRMKKHVAEGQHPWGFPGRGTSELHDGFEHATKEPANPKLVY